MYSKARVFDIFLIIDIKNTLLSFLQNLVVSRLIGGVNHTNSYSTQYCFHFNKASAESYSLVLLVDGIRMAF
jgi:hypothetical protein